MRPLVAAGLIAAALAPAARADHREIVQASLGPSGGNGGPTATYGGQTPDGRSIFFDTAESLVAQDANGLTDSYERRDGVTRLVSASEDDGTAGGGGFVATSPDGSVVVLLSAGALVAADDDGGRTDLYARAAGHTVLLTARDPEVFGLAIGTPVYLGMSSDANLVFFQTSESLLESDTDGTRPDVYSYAIDSGQLRLVTRFSGPYDAIGMRDSTATSDGATVFFTTRAPLDGNDTDTKLDVYARTGSANHLVSNVETATPEDVVFQYRTPDGEHAFFSTAEPLDAADTDDRTDVYRWDASDDSVHLVSVGPQAGTPDDAAFQRASADGSRVWWSTYERLAAGDADAFSDVYLREGDADATVETTGPAGGNAGPDDQVFSGITPDGARMYFRTHERLTPDDTDFAEDVYERYAGQTRRVTIGAQNDNGPYFAALAGVSPDGARVVFQTNGRFTAADTDDAEDLYERFGGVTTLLTAGSADEPAVFGGLSADASQLVFRSVERLASTDTDSDDVSHSCDGAGLSDGCDVFVARLNRSPAMTVDPAAATRESGGAAEAVDPALTVTDADTPALTGASVAVTGGPGTLGFADAGGITGVVGDGGTTLTLSGAATPAAYQAALRTVTFAASGAGGERTITFTVTDGVDVSPPVSRSVTVTAPAPAPGPAEPVAPAGSAAPAPAVAPFSFAFPPPGLSAEGTRSSEDSRRPAGGPVRLEAPGAITLRRLREQGVGVRLLADRGATVTLELRSRDGRLTFGHVRAYGAGSSVRERLRLTRDGARRARRFVHTSLRIVASGVEDGAAWSAGADLYLRR